MNTDKTSLENKNQPSCLGAVISWVAVAERLPKDKQYVIVTNGKQVIMAQYYQYSQKFVLADKELHVTYWMELPKPPCL